MTFSIIVQLANFIKIKVTYIKLLRTAVSSYMCCVSGNKVELFEICYFKGEEQNYKIYYKSYLKLWSNYIE